MSRRVLIETTRPGLFTGWRVVGEHFDDRESMRWVTHRRRDDQERWRHQPTGG